MSRAKKFIHNGEDVWFDYKSRATVEQLELLADYEGLEIDDLLDEGLSQRQVAQRLFEATSYRPPPEILEKRARRRLYQGREVACRICTLNGWECEGRITRHHFTPRWLMLELANYQAYSSRAICTIPICVGRHRDLHLRDDTPKSILPYLRVHERQFAQKMLDEIKAEHPKIYELILGGSPVAYEYQLVMDHKRGGFANANGAYDLDEYGLDRAVMGG